jgi:hypothetical protein
MTVGIQYHSQVHVSAVLLALMLKVLRKQPQVTTQQITGTHKESSEELTNEN